MFDLLVLLIERRDRVVSKDELFDRIWPGRYISEATLSAGLKELRKALGDSAKTKTAIKTVHGTGLRIIAPLAEPAARADAARADATPARAQPPPTAASDAAGLIYEPGPMPLAPAAGSERRSISALRCGLTAPERLGGRIGAEAMHFLLHHFLLHDVFALTQDVVARCDGQVTQWLSDGFLALFGASVAVDDHARRALLAAFELLERSRAPRARHRAALSVGLSSGTAIVGTVPDNPQQRHTALGSMMRLAETLRYAAGPDRVLLSDASYRLLRADVRVRAAETVAKACADRRDHRPARTAQIAGRGRRPRPRRAGTGAAAAATRGAAVQR